MYTSRVEAIGQYGFKVKDEIITTDFSFNRHVQDSWYGIVSFDAVQAAVSYTHLDVYKRQILNMA